MGLFGNKDDKTNKDSSTSKEVAIPDNKSNQANTITPASTQAQPSANLFQSLSSNVCGVCDSWSRQKQEWRDCAQVKEIQQFRKEFSNYFCHPLAKAYRSLPDAITNFKYNAFGQYTYKERLLALEGATLLVAIFTFGRRCDVGAVNRLLYSTRNSALTYMLGGLLIAPEVYNPLLKSDL